MTWALAVMPAQVQHLHGAHASGDQDRPPAQLRHRRSMSDGVSFWFR
ncbi:hypothetical protein ACQP2K_26305 [Microbispora siamensis]